MRVAFLLSICAVLLTGCAEISFPVSQPAGVDALKEIPKPLRGRYLGTNDKGTDTDTLVVEAWGYHFKDTADKDVLGRGVLSDSLVIKNYSGYYFVNFRVADQWVLRLISQKPSGDINFMSIRIGEDKQKEAVLKKLGKKFKVTFADRGGDKFYQINPSKEQLMQLIKEGYFTGDALSKLK